MITTHKKFLLLITTLLTLNANAQNWQTFFSNKDVFYKGTISGGSAPISLPGLIRAYHVDSIEMSGADSIFHIFKSVRTTAGLCLDEKAASWIGDKVIIKPNGDNIVFNVFNDTINIQSQTQLSDSFILYRFSNGDYINAIVTALSVDSVLGVLDSIKTFTINAKDTSGNSVSNYFNGLSFSISKNNGIVSNFIWSIFPLAPDTFLFSTVNANRLSSVDIYDFEIGDIFQFHNGCYSPSNPGGYIEHEIIGKWFSPAGDTVFYERKVSTKFYTFILNPPQLDSTLATYIDTVFYTNLNNLLFNGAYPEQSIIDTNLTNFGGLTWYLMQSDTGEYNGRTFVTYSLVSYIWNGSCFEQNPFSEYVVNSFTNIVGCGAWQSSIYDNTTGGPTIDCFSNLIYFKKGSEIFGNPVVVSSIEEIQAHSNIMNIYPNPATTTLNVILNKPENIYIINILGELVLQKVNSLTLNGDGEIDISFLSSGVYFIKVGNSVQKFVKL